MLKLKDFLKKDFKIVENRKYFFLVPIVTVLIALIFMASFVLAEKDALATFNFGMDFTGGYKMTVKLGEKIQNNNYDDLTSQINAAFDNVVIEDGTEEGIPVNIKGIKITTQSSGNDKAFVVAYQKPASISEDQMDEVNDIISDRLEKSMFNIVPSVSINGNTVSVSYDNLSITDKTVSVIADNLQSHNIEIVDNISNSRDNGVTTFTFNLANGSSATESSLVSALTIADLYAGRVINSGKVSGSVSDTLIKSALGAVAFAVVLMFIYIVIRFRKIGVSAAIATILALMHDVIIMFCFMAIFRVELGSSFIAGLVTILGYSINNTIVIFDRIRENSTMNLGKLKPAEIANKSVKDTFWRSVNTTFTTLSVIGCLAILCVADVQIFALPIIVGLIAGAYSSMVIAPSAWALMQQAKQRKIKKALASKRKA